MSSTVTWQADKGNTTRKSRSSGATAGAGNCKRHYVGNYDGFQRESFLHFTPNWSGVGRIVSATLTLYADDGFGILGDTMPAGSPLIYVRKLTAAFSEGTASATYDTDDYTNPANTSSGAKQAE